MKRHDGFALMLVIWAILLLTALAAGFARAVQHQTRLAQDSVTDIEREAAMATALNFALYRLGVRDDEDPWIPDGRRHAVTWENHRFTVRVRSESGKIDLNQAPDELLARLIVTLLPNAPAEALVDALSEWRASTDRPSSIDIGSLPYRAEAQSRAPAQRPLLSVNELAQVPGFDAPTIDALAPYLTVFSRRATINAISADLPVLRSLPGVRETDAIRFSEQRRVAIADDREPPFALLQDGLEYIDTHLDSRVLTLDLAISLDGTGSVTQQLIVQRGSDGTYQVIAQGRTPDRETPPQ